jgi:hypothetical protein
MFNDNNGEFYMFIHIPKNGGKYIKKKIVTDNKNHMIYLPVDFSKIKQMHYQHIPYSHIQYCLKTNIKFNYFAHSRNPYHRIISAYFYKNLKKHIEDFKHFIKTILVNINFDLNYDKNDIHYYPQYLFVCDENLELSKNIRIYSLEECEDPKIYDLIAYYDDECIQIINKIYEKDFILFNYEMVDSVNNFIN